MSKVRASKVKSIDVRKKAGWKDVPLGGVIPSGGTAVEYKSGEWRVERPAFDKEKCTNCMFCFIYCPDDAILTEAGEVVGIDYEHCKGCGICAAECPRDAITMKLDPKYEMK